MAFTSVVGLTYSFKNVFPFRFFSRKMSYELKSVQVGCEVRGLNLASENRPEVIQQIVQDVTKHRLLIFKDQGVISGPRQVEISQWFGPLDSTFYKHHKSPHPDVFRVSNDKNEGCIGVGRTGWHIDGSFQERPFSYSLYHMVKVPERGATAFAPLTELLERLSPEKLAKWERLWMVSDRRTGPIHPLVYKHPHTQKPVMCFHLGMTCSYMWDKGSPNEQMTEDDETASLSAEIQNEFVRNGGSIQYVHKWEPGDFIISDNLAVGHEATPETQESPKVVGLRVLHRTTVKGEFVPKK